MRSLTEHQKDTIGRLVAEHGTSELLRAIGEAAWQRSRQLLYAEGGNSLEAPAWTLDAINILAVADRAQR